MVFPLNILAFLPSFLYLFFNLSASIFDLVIIWSLYQTWLSPDLKTYYGKYYKRKGGAWKVRKNGDIIFVGAGNGTLSRRTVEQDKKRKATKSRKLRSRYPHEYD